MRLRAPRNLGMFLLAVWLILYGLLGGVLGLKLSFSYGTEVSGVLAIITGVLLLVGR